MTEPIQVNVRVPPAARPAIVKIARLLREDVGFLHRLARFLEEETDPHVGALISQRLDRLEAQVQDLIGFEDLPVVKRVSSRPLMVSADPKATWTAGEGRGRRLTQQGEFELHRLIDLGQPDAQIARRLGVKTYTVATRRAKIEGKSGGG